MIKTAGAIIILLSSIFAGFYQKHRLITRKKALNDMILAIDFIIRELKFSNIEIPDLLNKLSRFTVVGQIFSDFDISFDHKISTKEKWKNSLDKYQNKLNLSLEDIQKLENLPEVLGKYDVLEQIKTLEQIKESLKQELNNLGEKIKNEGNINRTICILIGFVVVIILI